MHTPRRPLCLHLATALVALATTAGACHTETAATNTAGYAPAPAPGSTGGSVIVGVVPEPSSAAGSACTTQLTVTNLQRRASCTIDERVTGHPGVLSYPCAGGPAQARFGATHFSGEVRGGNVTVEIETRFPFSDGCQWSSKQRIVGALASGALAYEYLEAPLPGQQGCAPACSASGSVLAQ